MNIVSNHPPNILRFLLKYVEKRMSETSSNKDDESIKIYKDALKDSGFKDQLN